MEIIKPSPRNIPLEADPVVGRWVIKESRRSDEVQLFIHDDDLNEVFVSFLTHKGYAEILAAMVDECMTHALAQGRTTHTNVEGVKFDIENAERVRVFALSSGRGFDWANNAF